MRSPRSQRGASLILIIGVIAALAIMASALVVLVANVQGNTARDRGRVKAFNVAEGGIDAAQNMLWQQWPTSTSTVQDFDTDAFRGLFDTTEFPDPAVGQSFVDVQIRDDVDGNAKYDATRNGILVIDSTARVGRSAGRVQVQVQRIPFDLRIRDGVALYSDGLLTLNGVGSSVSGFISPFDVMPPATGAMVYGQGGLDKSQNVNFPTDTVKFLTDPSVTANDIFPDAIRDELIRLADKNGNRIDASQADKNFWLKAFTKYPHVVAIKSGSLTVTSADIPMSNNPQWPPPAAGTDKWIFGPGPDEPLPGIIIVENGDLTFNGNAFFFGILYSMHGFVDTGTTEVHGMVITKGPATLKGSRNIVYDPNVLANLSKIVPISVRLVPNTWKELRP